MKDTTIKKIFGSQKLQAADPEVIAMLESIGPWGIAALAAYLAGQGLVQLAQKVQSMRTATGFTPSITLTPEETARVREAIAAVQMGSPSTENQEWIRNNPPPLMTNSYEQAVGMSDAWNIVHNSMTEIIRQASHPPNGPDKCSYLRNLLKKLEGWRTTKEGGEVVEHGDGPVYQLEYYEGAVRQILLGALRRFGCQLTQEEDTEESYNSQEGLITLPRR